MIYAVGYAPDLGNVIAVIAADPELEGFVVRINWQKGYDLEEGIEGRLILDPLGPKREELRRQATDSLRAKSLNAYTYKVCQAILGCMPKIIIAARSCKNAMEDDSENYPTRENPAKFGMLFTDKVDRLENLFNLPSAETPHE